MKFQSAGAAFFTSSVNDPDRCSSRYGEGSVLVEVWIFNKALAVLAHEFGHLDYVVPNLKAYVRFYKQEYGPAGADVMLGHRMDDPSGRVASVFEERFRKSYAAYLRKDPAPVMAPLALISPIRRDLLEHGSN